MNKVFLRFLKSLNVTNFPNLFLLEIPYFAKTFVISSKTGIKRYRWKANSFPCPYMTEPLKMVPKRYNTEKPSKQRLAGEES